MRALFKIATVMALACVAQAQAAEQSKPNIVLVLVDDLGFSDLGCYGGDIDTPVLDELAESGLRFTRFTNSAKCTTSRYSLLSGQYHGAGYPKMKRSTTLAEPLKKAGYATWAIGKWDKEQFSRKEAQSPVSRNMRTRLHQDNETDDHSLR